MSHPGLRPGTLVLLFLLLSYNTIAQECKKDFTFSLSYGTFGLKEMSSDAPNGQKNYTEYYGQFTATVRYALAKRFSIGLAYCYAGGNQLNYSSTGNPTTDYTRFDNHTIAISCRKIWINRKIFRWYSLLDLAETNVRFGTNSDRYWIFDGQLTPVGISIGNRLSGNIELGYGYRGFICLGVTYNLRNPNQPTTYKSNKKSK